MKRAYFRELRWGAVRLWDLGGVKSLRNRLSTGVELGPMLFSTLARSSPTR